MKIRRKHIKGDAKNKTVAALLLEVMPLRPQCPKAKRTSNRTPKNLKNMSLGSSTITIIRKVTIPEIVQRQKTNCILGNFHVGDCDFRGLSPLVRLLYLVSSRVSEKPAKQVLINSNSKVNTITPVDAAKLGLTT